MHACRWLKLGIPLGAPQAATQKAWCSWTWEQGKHTCSARDHRDPESVDSWQDRGSTLRTQARPSASHASLSACCTSDISPAALSYLPASQHESAWPCVLLGCPSGCAFKFHLTASGIFSVALHKACRLSRQISCISIILHQ